MKKWALVLQNAHFKWNDGFVIDRKMFGLNHTSHTQTYTADHWAAPGGQSESSFSWRRREYVLFLCLSLVSVLVLGFRWQAAIIMSVCDLRVLSESSAPLVIVHKAKYCALQVALFLFYPLTFDEVVCVYNLKYVAKKPLHFLLALFQNLHTSPPPPECVCIQYVCVRVCVHTCDETLPVLFTEIKFQKDQKYTRQSC